MTLLKIFILMVIIILLLSNYRVKITLKISGDHSYFSIEFSKFRGLLKYKYEIPLMDIMIHKNKLLLKIIEIKSRKNSYEKKSEDKLSTEEIKVLIHKILNYKRVYQDAINYILEKVCIQNLDMDIKIGLNDAATTAILYGITNAVVTIPINLLIKDKEIQNLNTNISPVFNKNILDINFNCIIIFKLAHIITTRKKLLRAKTKGGEVK